MSRGSLAALVLVALTGCHRMYEIRGEIIVAPSAVRKGGVPAFICAGHGGPLASSGIYGQPAYRSSAAGITVLCQPPVAPVSFILEESIYYGSVPRRAHVYAWLVRAPAADVLCKNASADGTITLDYDALDRLVMPVEAAKPWHHRSPATRLCGQNPRREDPLAFAITFDPDNKSWNEKGGTWTERRTLRID